MKFIILIFVVSPVATLANLNYYPAKYQNALNDHESNPALKEILFDVIAKNHRVLSHKDMKKHLFGLIHLFEDQDGYYVQDYYCNKKIREDNGAGPMLEPENSVINTEHTWPRSNFSKKYSKQVQTDDLHHLFPTYSRANSYRSNYPLGDVINGSHLSEGDCDASSRGPVVKYNYKEKYFEPPRDVKGDLARAMFYFSVRYKLQIDQTEEFFLRLWHEFDPVSQWEIERHEMVYEIQNNRNPFIDYPHLVQGIPNF